MSHSEYDEQANPRRPQEPTWPRPWHRLRSVREREQISLNALARRTRIKESELRQLEDEEYDMPISMLYRLAEGLRVPIEELLFRQNGTFSEPVRQRASLLRIARTAHTILAKCKDKATRHLAQTLVDQLIDLMPELAEAGMWPEVGKRRLPTDMARTEERVFAAFPTVVNDAAADCWDHTSPQDV